LCAIRLVLADEAARAADSSCRVIFMDRLKAEPRLRTVQGGTINLLQGRSSSDEPQRYPGDRHINVNANDRVTIQIHTVRVVTQAEGVSERGGARAVLAPSTPALAIYLPPQLRKDVIVQKNH
jgi:hypothetical protein